MILKINGEDMSVPDGATTERFFASQGSHPYVIEPDGTQRFLEPQEPLSNYENRRLGTVDRFINGCL